MSDKKIIAVTGATGAQGGGLAGAILAERDFNDDYTKARSLDFSRQLNPDLQTLDVWLAENASRVPLG
jgi:hypothetical protein